MQTFVMSGVSIANYGEQWRDLELVVTYMVDRYMPAEEFFERGRPDGSPQGYDGKGTLHDLRRADTGEELQFSLYDWELQEAPGLAAGDGSPRSPRLLTAQFILAAASIYGLTAPPAFPRAVPSDLSSADLGFAFAHTLDLLRVRGFEVIVNLPHGRTRRRTVLEREQVVVPGEMPPVLRI